jgi:hypothetical protein
VTLDIVECDLGPPARPAERAAGETDRHMQERTTNTVKISAIDYIAAVNSDRIGTSNSHLDRRLFASSEKSCLA